jgi:linoleoyl-CoA desaturase
VDAHFRQTGAPRRGGTEAVATTAGLLALYLGSWLLMLFNPWGALATLGLALVFGTFSVLLVFLIGHDAAHNALFDSARWNRRFAQVLSFISTTAYLWDFTHNRIHHAFPNVADWDTDIQQQAPLIRVSPTVPWRWYHRFQAGYAPALYLTITLYLVFLKDFQDLDWLPRKDSKALEGQRHPPRRHLALLGSKLLHCAMTIALPLWVMDVSLAQFAFGFLLVHAWMSLILAVVLIPPHVVDGARFAFVSPDGVIEDAWATHVLETTLDYAPRSRLLTWLTGGLNLHAVHHLFPSVFHGHYRALAELVAEVAQAHGLTYRRATLAQAVAAHFRLLCRMSKAQPQPCGAVPRRSKATDLVRA